MRYALILLLLSGCQGFRGPGQPVAVVGVGSPWRDTVEPKVGVAYEWETGAAVEFRYEPWIHDGSQTSRGQQEIGRVFAEARIPLGVRDGR